MTELIDIEVRIMDTEQTLDEIIAETERIVTFLKGNGMTEEQIHKILVNRAERLYP